MAKYGGNLEVQTFYKDINGWLTFVEDAVKDVVYLTVEKASEDIVKLSPVDTGRFKGNWQVTANAPAQQALIDRDVAGSDTIARLKRQARAVANAQSTKVIFISNVVDYSVYLEYGSSLQAPNGVLGVVETRLGRYFSEAVEESRKKR